MRQTLFYIQDQVADIPVFGLGLLFVLWSAFSVGLIFWLVRRQGFSADTVSYLPIVALVAAAIYFVLPGLIEPGHGLPIRSYGVMTMLGIVAGVTLSARRAPAAGIPPDAVYSFAVWLCVAGFIGARLFHVIEYWKTSYLQLDKETGELELGATLAAIVNVPKGGLVVYGSFIGGMLIFVWYMRSRKLPALAFADLMAPSMVLGLTLGRIGCLLNGCCFGGTCDVPWSVTFPLGSPPYVDQVERGLAYGLQVRWEAPSPSDAGPAESTSADDPITVIDWVDGDLAGHHAGLKPGQRIAKINQDAIVSPRQVQETFKFASSKEKPVIITLDSHDEYLLDPLLNRPRSLPIQPTQIYSAINAGLLCLFLLAFHPFRRRDGVVFGLLITIYPVARILLEIIRTDEAAMFGTGLSISQIVSVLLLIGVVVYWIYILRQPPGSLWADDHTIVSDDKRRLPRAKAS